MTPRINFTISKIKVHEILDCFDFKISNNSTVKEICLESKKRSGRSELQRNTKQMKRLFNHLPSKLNKSQRTNLRHKLDETQKSKLRKDLNLNFQKSSQKKVLIFQNKDFEELYSLFLLKLSITIQIGKLSFNLLDQFTLINRSKRNPKMKFQSILKSQKLLKLSLLILILNSLKNKIMK